MVTEGLATGVAAHDGRAADVKGIVETLLRSVAQVDHDAQTVHLADDLLTETTHTSVGRTATG